MIVNITLSRAIRAAEVRASREAGDRRIMLKTRDVSESFSGKLRAITGRTMSPKPRGLHTGTTNDTDKVKAPDTRPCGTNISL